MPTALTHAFVGMSAAAAVASRGASPRLFALSMVCSVLPDADVLAFAVGIPYSHPLGHRGFFHSPCFAVIVSLTVVAVFFHGQRVFSQGWWILIAYFFLLGASHGILDAFTNGGLGIALLAPFDHTRYFFSTRPIIVSPIGLSAFLTNHGLDVLKSEVLWVCAPTLLLAGSVRWIIRPVFVRSGAQARP